MSVQEDLSGYKSEYVANRIPDEAVRAAEESFSARRHGNKWHNFLKTKNAFLSAQKELSRLGDLDSRLHLNIAVPLTIIETEMTAYHSISVMERENHLQEAQKYCDKAREIASTSKTDGAREDVASLQARIVERKERLEELKELEAATR